MGCLFACFGASKHRNRRRLVNRHEASEDLRVTESTKQEETDKPIAASIENVDEPVICSTKKAVTFDLDVKNHEESPPIEEVIDNLVKDNEREEIEKKEEKETPKETILVPDSVTPNVVSHLPNNRYQNCATSEDESEDLGLEESDLDDDSDGDKLGSNEKMLVQEESSESLFSLSIDSRKHVCEVELGEKEVSSPMPICLNGNARDRSQYVHSVLNPVENLTQWKAVKARATPPPIPPSRYQAKENINLVQDLEVPICPVLSFKLLTDNSVLKSNNKKFPDQEIGVDTSLSSWLVESETTPMSKTSTVSVGNSPSHNASKPISSEDESMLAAEKHKQLSPSTSPKRSRSQSSDEFIIGTVGSYWSCTGKNMDSNSSQGMPMDRSNNKEDGRVKWGAIPFDEALRTGIAEV